MKETCSDTSPLLWLERAKGETNDTELRLGIVPPRLLTYVNSGYPRSRNDGTMWAGRGATLALDGGVYGAWEAKRFTLSAGLAPQAIFTQNAAFDIATGISRSRYSPYIYPWHATAIDWPQRFGDRSFWTVDPGQSFVRLDAFGAMVSFSTENLWWGPALRNPLLLSSNAPGFPHVAVGTSRPVDVWIGNLEVEAIWGYLDESDHFDVDPDNDRRLMSGLIVDFEPRWLPGLYLGLARIHTTTIPPEGMPFDEMVLGAYQDVRDNPQGRIGGDNQLISVFGRWAHPGVGFEAYFEWAREDHWMDLMNLFMVPDGSQAYTLGFQKVIDTESKWVRLYGELTHLGDALPIIHAGRGVLSYYTHSQIRQGHTHKGQILGAAIGPGSDAQILGVDVFHGGGLFGGSIERVRYDTDAYYAAWSEFYGPHGHDVEFTGEIHRTFFVRDFDIAWGVGYSHRYNRNFIGLDGANWDFRVDGNWQVRLDVTWRPDQRREPERPRPPVTTTDSR